MEKKSFRNIALFIAACLACPFMLSSCLDVGGDDDTPPFGIYSTSPEEGSTNVSIDTAIVITFETDVDPDSVTASTFLVRDQSNAYVTGDVYADGVVADFRPDVNYEENTTYTVILDETIADIHGRTLGDFVGGDYTFNFTTGTQVSGDSQ